MDEGSQSGLISDHSETPQGTSAGRVTLHQFPVLILGLLLEEAEDQAAVLYQSTQIMSSWTERGAGEVNGAAPERLFTLHGEMGHSTYCFDSRCSAQPCVRYVTADQTCQKQLHGTSDRYINGFTFCHVDSRGLERRGDALTHSAAD